MQTSVHGLEMEIHEAPMLDGDFDSFDAASDYPPMRWRTGDRTISELLGSTEDGMSIIGTSTI